MKQLVIFFVILSTILFSCRNKTARDIDRKGGNDKETLIRINQMLVQKDYELIKGYIERRGWEMEEDQGGFWFQIYEKTESQIPAEGNWVELKYKIWLLDGTLCYSSEESGNKTFKLGQNEEISGLNLALFKMRLNEKGRFVFLPHLAYGLIGV